MPKTMLVVDDSIVIQKSIGIMFSQEDYAITYCGNAQDAFQKAKLLKPDIILSDTVMPGQSGYEFVAKIRQDDTLGQIPVILLTGAAEQVDDAKASQAGANGFIIKPCESHVLVQKVASVVGTGAPAAAAQVASPSVSSPAATVASTAPKSPTSAPPPSASPAATIARAVPPSYTAPASTPPTPPAPTPSPTPGPSIDMGGFDIGLDSSFDVSSQPPAELSSPAIETTQPLPQGTHYGDAPHAEHVTSETLTSTSDDDIWSLGAPDADQPLATQATVPSTPEPTDHIEMSGSLFESPSVDVDFSDPSPEPVAAPADTVGASFSFEESVETAAPIEVDFDAPAEDESLLMQADPQPAPEARPEMSVEAPVPVAEFSFEDTSAPQSSAHVAALIAPAPSSSVELSDAQIERIVTQVFQKVIERIAWEVVPDMAERIIKEELARLTQD